MTVSSDKKFYSMYALRHNYKNLQKSKEHIIISNDCFWTINPEMLSGVNYERYGLDKEWLSKQNFDPEFQSIFKELVTAIQCNDLKYTDEIIFVGMPWELKEAHKYFGDAMLVNGYV